MPRGWPPDVLTIRACCPLPTPVSRSPPPRLASHLKTHLEARLRIQTNPSLITGWHFPILSSSSRPFLHLSISDLLCCTRYHGLYDGAGGGFATCHYWMWTTAAWPLQVSVAHPQRCVHICCSRSSQVAPLELISLWLFCCRFVGRINIYKDKEEPVARWVGGGLYTGTFIDTWCLY